MANYITNLVQRVTHIDKNMFKHCVQQIVEIAQSEFQSLIVHINLTKELFLNSSLSLNLGNIMKQFEGFLEEFHSSSCRIHLKIQLCFCCSHEQQENVSFEAIHEAHIPLPPLSAVVAVILVVMIVLMIVVVLCVRVGIIRGVECVSEVVEVLTWRLQGCRIDWSYRLGLCMGCFGVLLQVGVVIESHSAFFTHDIFGLLVNLVHVLAKIGVFALTLRAFRLEL